jgi:hypothetical protein
MLIICTQETCTNCTYIHLSVTFDVVSWVPKIFFSRRFNWLNFPWIHLWTPVHWEKKNKDGSAAALLPTKNRTSLLFIQLIIFPKYENMKFSTSAIILLLPTVKNMYKHVRVCYVPSKPFQANPVTRYVFNTSVNICWKGQVFSKPQSFICAQ